MNDYTPTTEEVRERFIDGFPIDTWAVARDSVGQDFDSWLRQVKAEAWAEGFDAGHYTGDEPRECECKTNPYLDGDNK